MTTIETNEDLRKKYPCDEFCPHYFDDRKKNKIKCRFYGDNINPNKIICGSRKVSRKIIGKDGKLVRNSKDVGSLILNKNHCESCGENLKLALSSDNYLIIRCDRCQKVYALEEIDKIISDYNQP